MKSVLSSEGERTKNETGNTTGSMNTDAVGNLRG